MYPSTDTKYPLYSIPHLSFTITGLPVRPLRKGLGFKGIIVCRKQVQALNSHRTKATKGFPQKQY